MCNYLLINQIMAAMTEKQGRIVGVGGRLHIGPTTWCLFNYKPPEATLKKTLFPVQRVAEIVARRVAAKSFFPPFIFLCV